MSFSIENVRQFFDDNKSICDEPRAQQIIQLAEDIAYLDFISGAQMEEVMQEFAPFFDQTICNSKIHSAIFARNIITFGVQDEKLRKLREGVEKSLIDGGFKKHHKRKLRGFEILNIVDDMAVYNFIGGLAGERVKDMGVVVMSIGFGDMMLERDLGEKYKNCLETSRYACQLIMTPVYPEATGATYLYVKDSWEA